MMQRKKIDVDVVRNILVRCSEVFPKSGFIAGLLHQYDNLGGLSRKQMVDLHTKAQKVEDMPEKWLATLEAEILKKPVRYKSPTPPATPQPMLQKNEAAGKMIIEILAKYPQHKRVLFLQSKYDNNEPLSNTDIAELERFHKFIVK
jgi:hypothetical protein